MQFTQQRAAGQNLIRRYDAEFIVIGERQLNRSCIVGASTLIDEWAPTGVESLRLEHLAVLFDLAPEVVVLSTGATQKFPPAALRAEFATRKIGLEVMEVGAACRTYNVLVAEERKVLAAMLLPG